MARLAVLTDRLPSDPSWKGAYTWELILGLAESQHEVTVFTTQDPDAIPFTHSRLTIARPAPSFSVDRMPKWTQALLTYRPHFVHSFALQTSSTWPSLTVWPYLDAVCKVLPGVKRVSTMFDAEDFKPGQSHQIWHAGSEAWTVFTRPQERLAREVFQGRIDVVPLEDPRMEISENAYDENGYTFVPAPVSEWMHPQHGVVQLADYLLHNPSATVYINGGWGDLSLIERRRGWAALGETGARVRLLEPQSLTKFLARAKSASRVWIEGLKPDTWRFLLSVQVAQTLGKELIGSTSPMALPAGSTTNFLSRIYVS